MCAGLVEVRRPQWVSTARHTVDGWQLFGRGLDQGTYDAVVIAHIGAQAAAVAGRCMVLPVLEFCGTAAESCR